MKKIYYIFGLVILVGAIFAIKSFNNQPGEYDDFTQCLADSGTKMYGAWWCGHCAEQKKSFGKSWDVLVKEGGYIECSTTQRTQTEFCRQAGITSYPTWRFPDGSELKGKLDFFALAQKSGCEL